MARETSISMPFLCKPGVGLRVYSLEGPVAGRSGGVGLANDEDQILLLARLRRGERLAFEELADRYGGRMLRTAHRLLGWSGGGDAQDVVQDILARMLARPERIAAGGVDIERWMIAVTVNECRTQRRRWLARLKVLRRWPIREAVAPAADLEIQEQVRAAVRRLGSRDREVIVLHYLEEMTVMEIANILGLTCNAVEVRLHRARGRLAEKLERFVKE
jgi:RNA polymerase sigma-70 factor, ECF subfamily